MDQEKENEDKQDTNKRTAGILNGDVGDGNTGEEDEGSSPQADRTATESPPGNEDSAGTEGERSHSEGLADHKVRALLRCVYIALVCTSRSLLPGCSARCETGSSVLNSPLGFFNAAVVQLHTCVYVCVLVCLEPECVCSNPNDLHMPWV